jgi:hypothetical protein
MNAASSGEQTRVAANPGYRELGELLQTTPAQQLT